MIVAAGGSMQVLAEGSFFRVYSSSGPVAVTVDTVGELGPLLAGQGLKDTPFKRLFVRDLSGSANIVQLIVADASFVDDRITGEVSVIDGGKSRTIAGQMGMINAQTSAAVGFYSMCGLWNPVGSGRRAIVKRMFISTATAQIMYIGRVAAPPAVLGLPLSGLFNGSAYSGACKSAGDNTLNSLAGLSAGGVFTQSVSPLTIQLDEPVVVMPGYGFVVSTSTLNTDCSLFMPFVEESF